MTANVTICDALPGRGNSDFGDLTLHPQDDSSKGNGKPTKPHAHHD